MNVLIIGGTRFIGYQLVWRLLAAGHGVTVLNRGKTPTDLDARVRRLTADRTNRAEFSRVIANSSFDAVVDFAAYTGDDARAAVEVFGNGHAGHYIFISTGQVYLVCENCPKPSRESDYDNRVMPEPSGALDRGEWLYGVHKRAAEDALAEASRARGFPATRLRLPMVNGERDYFRRIESYLWRILDGGPVLLPMEDKRVARHVYGQSVVRAICAILGESKTFGEAYNLAQDEMPTVPELITILAELLGAPARIALLPETKLRAADLAPESISPFNVAWMSCLDPTKAKNALQFQHEPLHRYLDKIVTCFLNHRPPVPPENYVHRPAEFALASATGRSAVRNSPQ